MEKLEAHRAGAAHRAISVMLKNSAGEILLQQRSPAKYHAAGLWSNTCCGHPRPGENPKAAALRRLQAELGIQCELQEAGVFQYECPVTDDLVENEWVHLFVGQYDGSVRPDPDEVAVVDWRSPTDLAELIPGQLKSVFTPWFQIYMGQLPDFVRALGTSHSSH